MAQLIVIHETHPQPRLIQQAADILRKGGIVAYPTDASYALGCAFNDISALGKLRQVRRLSEKHHLTLMCEDVAQVSHYAKVDNRAFRLMRSLTPGPYTFLLDATREVPRKLQQKSKKSVGIRIPNNPILLALLKQLGDPIASTTCILPGEDSPICEPYEIEDGFGKQIDAVIDGGVGAIDETTVIDFTNGQAEIIRHGLGDTSTIE